MPNRLRPARLQGVSHIDLLRAMVDLSNRYDLHANTNQRAPNESLGRRARIVKFQSPVAEAGVRWVTSVPQSHGGLLAASLHRSYYLVLLASGPVSLPGSHLFLIGGLVGAARTCNGPHFFPQEPAGAKMLVPSGAISTLSLVSGLRRKKSTPRFHRLAV